MQHKYKKYYNKNFKNEYEWWLIAYGNLINSFKYYKKYIEKLSLWHLYLKHFNFANLAFILSDYKFNF